MPAGRFTNAYVCSSQACLRTGMTLQLPSMSPRALLSEIHKHQRSLLRLAYQTHIPTLSCSTAEHQTTTCSAPQAAQCMNSVAAPGACCSSENAAAPAQPLSAWPAIASASAARTWSSPRPSPARFRCSAQPEHRMACRCSSSDPRWHTALVSELSCQTLLTPKYVGSPHLQPFPSH